MAGQQETRQVPDIFVPEEGRPVPHAPEGTRYVGLCKSCRRFVELGPTFACMDGGHPKGDVVLALLVGHDEPLPRLPRMNWGALFMPALWGPGHGQWFMILFYPLWLVLDNLIYAAVHGTGSAALAVIAGLMAAAFTVYYALHANYYGYLRVAGTKTPEQYRRGERVWTVLGVAVGVLFLAFATWYNLAVRPGLAA
jgi:hypothetical protein